MQRKHRIILGVIIALAFAVAGDRACAQEAEHAPTLEQCTADINLWFAQLSDSGHLRRLKQPDLDERIRQTAACSLAHSSSSPRIEQFADLLLKVYVREGMQRATNFIGRHGLWEQFVAEDAAGLR